MGAQHTGRRVVYYLADHLLRYKQAWGKPLPVTLADIFDETSGQFAAIFVRTEPGKLNIDHFLT